jgi:hypothetical protein
MRGIAFPIERGSSETPMDRGPLPRLSYIRRGSHNETLFPHSGGEERRKKREKL